jgi:drug/metabolite transporter (DMT)-like permease
MADVSTSPTEKSASRSLDRRQMSGVAITLFSAIIAAWAPIFGKIAYRTGVDPYTVVALRTTLAVALLWVIYLARWRASIRIYWRDLLGCVGMGMVNGVGSLFYYTGLQRLDASLASLLYALYPIWVFIFLSSSGHAISRMAVGRLGLGLVGLYLITGAGSTRLDSLGVMLMLASGAAYGWHLVLGQWVLADVDSRTVTLYVLTTMAVIVDLARLVGGGSFVPLSTAGWEAILSLGAVMAFSRLTMFAGLKRLGGVQTALLSITELLTTLLVAFVVLGERLSVAQWVGAAILIASVVLVRRESSQE